MDEIKDIELSEKSTISSLVGQWSSAGFQGSHLSDAVDVVRQMKENNATVFLAFTANMVASGLRGVFAELCRKKFVDAVITTAGTIDHDVIKSFVPYLKGSFEANDVELHKKGVNRIGNILVPNDRFELFEKKMQGYLAELYKKGPIVSPSELTNFVGSKLSDKNSILRACHENKIPLFCPGITDGAVGLQSYFFKQTHSNFAIEVTRDMGSLSAIVLSAKKTGAIILGGGISKHHVIGINLVRGGLDYALYVSTADERDGSLSGARSHEAKSWGKIKEKGDSVNLFGDAVIVFPLIAAALKEQKLL